MNEIKVYRDVVDVPIAEIKPYENNARVNDKAVQALVKAIPTMGFNVPILIDKNKVIVKGHSRYEAMKQLGYTTIPCLITDGSEQEVNEERLVDNKVSELSTWDDDKLNYELREMAVDLRGMDIDVPYVKTGVNEVPNVQQKEVDWAERRIVGADFKTKAENQSFIEVYCKHCGETYLVRTEDAEKYAE